MQRIKPALIIFVIVSLAQGGLYAQAENPQKIPSDIKPALRKQIEKLHSPNPLERKRAALAIGELSKEAQDAIPFLIGLLGDSSPCPEPGVIYNHIPFVYETVSWALIQIGSPCVKPLINVLYSSDPLVRANAAYCLGAIGDKRATGPLLKLLNDTDFSVKRQAIRAFSKLKDKRATEHLLNLLTDEHLRPDVIYVLGKIGDARAIDTLSFYLKGQDTHIRMAAALALGDIGHKSAVPFLIDTLSGSDSQVKEAAVFSLGKVGDPSAVEALVSVVNNEKGQLQIRAIDALRHIGDAKAVEALIVFLGNDNRDVRKNAFFALNGIRGSGISLGEDPVKWKNWLNENKDRLNRRNYKL